MHLPFLPRDTLELRLVAQLVEPIGDLAGSLRPAARNSRMALDQDGRMHVSPRYSAWQELAAAPLASGVVGEVVRHWGNDAPSFPAVAAATSAGTPTG